MHFEAVNITAAHELGFLHRNDTDCAVSKPNALHSYPNTYTTPSVIRANATALAAQNLSEYFDVVAWSWKPLGPAPEFTTIGMDLWRIEGEASTYVDGLFAGWFDSGFLPVNTITPNEWWPGWGRGVNWIEMQSQTDEGERWDFCIDNIVLRFYKTGKDDGDDDGDDYMLHSF